LPRLALPPYHWALGWAANPKGGLLHRLTQTKV